VISLRVPKKKRFLGQENGCGGARMHHTMSGKKIASQKYNMYILVELRNKSPPSP
jgi:hypothetical protein